MQTFEIADRVRRPNAAMYEAKTMAPNELHLHAYHPQIIEHMAMIDCLSMCHLV